VFFLHRVENREDANKLEKIEIDAHDSINNGYNIRPGGNKELSEDTIEKIRIKAKSRAPHRLLVCKRAVEKQQRQDAGPS
jgi:chemotaxis response regulator CheB